METPQKVLVCFRQQNFLIFREAEILKKFRAGSIFEEKPTVKMFLIFLGMELSSSGLKELLVFLLLKFIIFLQKKL